MTLGRVSAARRGAPANGSSDPSRGCPEPDAGIRPAARPWPPTRGRRQVPIIPSPPFVMTPPNAFTPASSTSAWL